MVDIETGKVIDILNSRDYDDVKEWLNGYPNLKMVSRDGSITYSKAIKDSHSSVIQISDRFHLLKNLTDYCKEYIKRIIKHTIKLEVPVIKSLESQDILKLKKKYQYQTKWELILAVKELRSMGYTINQICCVLGLGNKSVINYSKIKNCDKEKYDKKPIAISRQEANRKRKEELIREVKLLKEKGYTISAISRELNLDSRTVKKYINSDGSFIHATIGRNFKSKLDGYKKEILTLFSKGYSAYKIYSIIKQNGFDGSDSLVRHFVLSIKNKKVTLHNQDDVENVERKNLITLLYKDIEKVKSITKNQLERILQIYPELKIVYEIAKQFREILFSKDAFKLVEWLNRAKALNISEINSFISGIERDFEAVRNAVMYKYSNGLAEGTVNKIKVIKRIMYGRCSFELLRKKVLLLNFN